MVAGEVPLNKAPNPKLLGRCAMWQTHFSDISTSLHLLHLYRFLCVCVCVYLFKITNSEKTNILRGKIKGIIFNRAYVMVNSCMYELKMFPENPHFSSLIRVCGVSDAIGVPWLWFRHYL